MKGYLQTVFAWKLVKKEVLAQFGKLYILRVPKEVNILRKKELQAGFERATVAPGNNKSHGWEHLMISHGFGWDVTTRDFRSC